MAKRVRMRERCYDNAVYTQVLQSHNKRVSSSLLKSVKTFR